MVASEGALRLMAQHLERMQADRDADAEKLAARRALFDRLHEEAERRWQDDPRRVDCDERAIARAARKIERKSKQNATLRLCDHERCWNPDCLSDSRSYPWRIVINRHGNKAIHTVCELLPNEARRLQFDHQGLPVYVGDRYRISKGRKQKGSAKWAWSLADELEVNTIEWIACLSSI